MCDKLEQRRQRFIAMARERHGDKYDYSLVQFNHEKHCKVAIICPTHGVFEQLASTHIAKRRNQQGYMGCRKCGTDARPRRQLCVDCGCWNKYGGTDARCTDCKAKHKQCKAQRLRTKYACRECGKYTGSRDRIYCSPKCRVAKNRIVVTCGNCQAEIVKPAKQVRRSSQLFCNPECQRLGQIGNVSRSRKAKRDWKIAQSARRRIKSIGYKWWRLCKLDWFNRLEISDWNRRCRNASSALRSRKKPAASVKPKTGRTWPQALRRARTKLNVAENWLNKDSWTKRIENQVGHLRRRRAVKNERNKS